MTSFQDLRQRRHTQWLTELTHKVEAIIRSKGEPSPQVYLFGSRARGDWDGLSDTDLIVVADTRHDAERWVDQLLDSGIAQDVIGLDKQAWHHLPNHPSVIWRHVARDAMPLTKGDS